MGVVGVRYGSERYKSSSRVLFTVRSDLFYKIINRKQFERELIHNKYKSV